MTGEGIETDPFYVWLDRRIDLVTKQVISRSIERQGPLTENIARAIATSQIVEGLRMINEQLIFDKLDAEFGGEAHA